MSEYADKVLLFVERVKGWRAGRVVAPVTLDLELTYRCDHRCPWCAFSELLHSRGPVLPVEVAHRVLEWAARVGVRSVIYSGAGEPTMHPKFIEIMRLTDSYGLDFAVFTNGSTLHQYQGEIPKRCRYIRVSVDAATQELHSRLHGAPPTSLRDLGEAIHALRASNGSICIGLSYVLTDVNQHEAVQLLDLAREWNVDQVFYRRDISRADFNKSVYETVAAAKTGGRPRVFIRDSTPFVGHWTRVCHTSPLKAVVDPRGHVYICCLRRGPTDMIGKATECDLDELWCSSRHREVWASIDVKSCPECRMRQYNEVVERHLDNEELAAFL